MILLLAACCLHRSHDREAQVEKYRARFLSALDSATFCKGAAGSPSEAVTCGPSCKAELGLNATTFDLHPAENALFGFIYAQVTNRSHSDMSEILGGAFVKFPDPNGCAHKFLITLPGHYKRISSHFSSTDQYGIKEGKVIDTILIGTSTDNVTWFQLEGAAFDGMHDISQSWKHTLDTILYVVTRRQMGPLGTSAHTEKQPLHMPTPSVPQYCALPCAVPPAAVPIISPTVVPIISPTVVPVITPAAAAK